jgi:hypothetical protein
MGKKFDDTVIDGALIIIKTGATNLIFCSSEPANYAGIAAVKLAEKTGLTSGSFTIADDAVSPYGRKITVAAQTGMTPTANGTITYAVLTNGSSILYAGTTVTSQAVTTAQTWDSPAFKFQIGDPV